MGQTKAGAIKRIAKKIGISVEEYIAHQSNGEKWCYRCSNWKSLEAFHLDNTRSDGRNSLCVDCCHVKYSNMAAKKPHKVRVKREKQLKKEKQPRQKKIKTIRTPIEKHWRASASRLCIPIDEYMLHICAGYRRCYACTSWKSKDSFDWNTQDEMHPLRCKDCAEWAKRKRPSSFKGQSHTTETIKRMRIASKGNKRRLGKKHTLETRTRISQISRERSLRGKQCHSYKDGKLAERRNQRFSREYKQWRYDVFSRDKFICQSCGDKRGGNLVAHHIKPFADYPELRFEVSNGLTLCKSCHNQLHYKAKEAS